jgi:hypothetical protein
LRFIGKHVAKSSLFINIARILWAYIIDHAHEEQNGRKVQCKVDSMAFVDGFNSSPLPFKVEFVPRSSSIKDIINAEWKTTEKDVAVLLGNISSTQKRSS